MIKAIIFDYGGIIGKDFSRYTYDMPAKKVGLTPDTFKRKIRKVKIEFQKGRISEDEFFEKASDITGVNESYLRKTWKMLEKISVNEKVVTLIKELKKKGYKIAILSNVVKTSHGNKSNKLFDHFHTVVFSYEVGARKPEIKIYKVTLKSLRVSPNEAVFIDDKERNLKTARKLGMKTILFKNSRQLKNSLRKLKVL